MNRIEEDQDFAPSAAIDRLVCGEISEEGRAELLGWLEADHVRWRLCGIAFLEAQTWSESMASSAVSSPLASRASPPSRPPSRVRGPAVWLAVAASLLAAFELGAWRRPASAPADRSGPASATELAVQQDRSGGAGGDAASSVHPVSTQGGDVAIGPPEPTEYERQICERYGYRLRRERRYISATLQDGTKVMVPVERNLADYVGMRVY